MKKMLFALLLLVILMPNSAFAESLNSSLSPSLITIKSAGANEVIRTIHLKNNSDHNISYDIAISPFEPSPLKNGEPILQNLVSKEYSELFHNISILDNDQPTTKIDLAPYQNKILKIVLNLPTTLAQKDYYFSVIFTTEENQDQSSTNVLINQAMAINLILSLGRLDTPSGKITDFSTAGFFNKGPVSFKVELSNTSQNFIAPQGNIQIKNMFGQTVGLINLTSENVLSGSGRVFDNTTWNEKLLLGIYSAKLSIALSPSGPIITKEIHFLAFPTKYLAILCIFGIFMLYVGTKVIKKRGEK